MSADSRSHPTEALVPASYQMAAWWTMTWEKRVPEKGQARYYQLTLQQDLWGDWVLLRAWGRIGHHPSRVVQTFVANQQAADALAVQIHRTRLRHGYRLQENPV